MNNTNNKIGTPLDYLSADKRPFVNEIKPINKITTNVERYVNFFGYKHPSISPPDWLAPTYENKQIIVKLNNY
jgi:hypothetical protein